MTSVKNSFLTRLLFYILDQIPWKTGWEVSRQTCKTELETAFAKSTVGRLSTFQQFIWSCPQQNKWEGLWVFLVLFSCVLFFFPDAHGTYLGAYVLNILEKHCYWKYHTARLKKSQIKLWTKNSTDSIDNVTAILLEGVRENEKRWEGEERNLRKLQVYNSELHHQKGRNVENRHWMVSPSSAVN